MRHQTLQTSRDTYRSHWNTYKNARSPSSLTQTNLATLGARRELACKKFLSEIKNDNPLYPVTYGRTIDIFKL